MPDLDASCANLVLRLLLGRGPETSEPVEWDRLTRFARQNVALVRVDAALDGGLASAAHEERTRVQATLKLIAALASLCDEHGIRYVLPKAFQHFPDMGHDIDLLVDDASDRIDRLIRARLGAAADKGSFSNWVSRKTGLCVPGYPSPLEIHHGRMGHLGEFHSYVPQVFDRRRRTVVAGVTAWVPAHEDQLIIQVIQRVYGHFSIRVSDVAHTWRLSSIPDLDWSRIEETARRLGILSGLRWYLGCCDRICREGIGQALPLAAVRPGPAGRVALSGGCYRLPWTAVLGRAWLAKAWNDFRAANWGVLGRLCLAPVAAGTVAATVASAKIRGFAAAPARTTASNT